MLLEFCIAFWEVAVLLISLNSEGAQGCQSLLCWNKTLFLWHRPVFGSDNFAHLSRMMSYIETCLSGSVPLCLAMFPCSCLGVKHAILLGVCFVYWLCICVWVNPSCFEDGVQNLKWSTEEWKTFYMRYCIKVNENPKSKYVYVWKSAEKQKFY